MVISCTQLMAVLNKCFCISSCVNTVTSCHLQCCSLSEEEVEAAVAAKRAELMAALEAEKQADDDK